LPKTYLEDDIVPIKCPREKVLDLVFHNYVKKTKGCDFDHLFYRKWEVWIQGSYGDREKVESIIAGEMVLVQAGSVQGGGSQKRQGGLWNKN